MKEEIKMIEETIRRIERMLQAETNLDQIKKKEIMDLFQSLEFEIKKIPQENVDIARSITKFTEASTYEATRKTKNDNLLNLYDKDSFTAALKNPGIEPLLIATLETIDGKRVFKPV